jgi:hypothetical protein
LVEWSHETGAPALIAQPAAWGVNPLDDDEPDGGNALLGIGRLLDKLKALVRPLLRRVLKR